MSTSEPLRIGDGPLRAVQRILRARGLDPRALPESGSEPDLAGRHEARIPPRYRGAAVGHPAVRAWADQVVAAAERPNPGARVAVTTGPSLLLAGPTGVGKTHEAYGAVRALADAGLAVRWEATTAADLYAELRPQPGSDPERVLARVSRVPLLLLDDLGAARSSEWVEEITYRLINRRYNLLLPTLITTNLPIRDLRTTLGDRIASRLAEMTDRVVLDGADRRRRSAA
ncbi:ATP-binding protein [Streptomyces sp. NPDC047046]|uniref:ATP-binding protein n=1 Tax=Streptomyces sp. NPDC047046 TaxID=3155378 RepID=UPI0033D693E1